MYVNMYVGMCMYVCMYVCMDGWRDFFFFFFFKLGDEGKHFNFIKYQAEFRDTD